MGLQPAAFRLDLTLPFALLARAKSKCEAAQRRHVFGAVAGPVTAHYDARGGSALQAFETVRGKDFERSERSAEKNRRGRSDVADACFRALRRRRKGSGRADG